MRDEDVEIGMTTTETVIALQCNTTKLSEVMQ
jgi:hypothetical protein